MGLCLGASIISVAELIDFISVKLLLRKIRQEKAVDCTREDNQKHSIVENAEAQAQVQLIWKDLENCKILNFSGSAKIFNVRVRLSTKNCRNCICAELIEILPFSNIC